MKFRIIPNQQTPKTETRRDITTFLKEDKKMLEKFISFSMRQKNCAGLASNQVSLDGQRIMESFFTMKDKNGWGIYVRPKIIEYHGKPIELKEGCLTWLGKTMYADRYYKVTMKYFNLRGEKFTKDFVDYPAQICQHEMNHLLGIEERFYSKHKEIMCPECKSTNVDKLSVSNFVKNQCQCKDCQKEFYINTTDYL